MAVYTHVRPAELDAFLAPFGIGPVTSFKGIAEGVENSNYLLKTDDASYILTLYEKRVDPADLPFYLGLMDFLANAGVRTARPLKDKSGALLGELCGRPAALIEFLEGVSAEPPSTIQARATAKAMAELHLAGASFPMSRANGLGSKEWAGLLKGVAPQLEKIEQGLREELEVNLKETLASWPHGLPAGVIHADLFPDNVLLKDGAVSGLIDFYFACNDTYAYDLAVMINAWCFEDGEFRSELSHAILEGYQSARPLSGDEMKALPILAQGAAIRFILTRAIDWINRDPGALVVPKDPRALLPNLRFHGTAKPSAYGAIGQ